MLKAVACTLFVITALLPLPDGWQVPGDEFASDNWRDDSETRFMEASGDFNGDGLTDHANILVSADNKTYGLFVFISGSGTDPEIHTLFSGEPVKYLRGMGIEKVEPGRYATACGKGYWECGDGEPPELELKNDAINYFMTESASVYFYWDEQSGGFRSISISD